MGSSDGLQAMEKAWPSILGFWGLAETRRTQEVLKRSVKNSL